MRTSRLMFFFVLPLCPLRLGGENAPKNANHKDTENTEVAKTRSATKSRSLLTLANAATRFQTRIALHVVNAKS